MPVQPDRHPGIREEEEIKFDPISDITQENGYLGYKTGVGFRFYEEGSEKGLSGTGITESQHEALDTLVHELAESSYEEVTRTSGRISNVTVWTNSGKTTKIRETVVTRSGGLVSQVDEIQYDASGVETVRMTGVVTRSGGRVSYITWTKTVA